MIFTEEELWNMTKGQLHRVGQYLDLGFPMRIKKADMVEIILSHQVPEEPSVEEKEPQMSVRVRRIKGA